MAPASTPTDDTDTDADADAHAEPARGPARSRALRIAAVAAIVGGLGVAWAGRPRPEPLRFCTADGYVLDDGTILGRDLDHGCRWVDETGTPVPTHPDGTPNP